MKNMIEISFIILNYNTSQMTKKCIHTLLKNKKLKNIKYEVILVDNCSTDGSYQNLRQEFYFQENVKVVKSARNGGFGYGNNYGVKLAKGKYIVLVNNDTLLDTVDIQRVKSVYEQIKISENIGILGIKLLNIDYSLQNVGFPAIDFWSEFKRNLLMADFKCIRTKFKYRDKGIVEVGWISGCFMFLEKTNYCEIDGFDEKIFMYAEDVDLCYRLKAKGKKMFVYDQEAIIHFGGGSNTTKQAPSLKKILESKNNYLYVLKKNEIVTHLNLYKFMNYFQGYLIWTLKHLIYHVRRLV